jgi:TIR domain
MDGASALAAGSAGERIFISYRSSDGRDKATSLARELGQRFGDAAVFLDKDDLRGGSRWREEIARTLGGQVARTLGPQVALVLLLTPDLLGAVGDDGRPRIHDADDPVRRELATALDNGAHVIPVLCDGVEAAPDSDTLPPPFNRLADFTWRRLRAYDWPGDVNRLADDLAALGIASAMPVAQPPTTPGVPPSSRRRRLMAAGTVIGLLGSGALIGWLQSPAPKAGLAGAWSATLVRGEQVGVSLTQDGDRITLLSAPLDISTRADWAEYRRFWRERFGADLDRVIYRGEGRFIHEPGRAGRIDLALQLLPAQAGEAVDSGNLSATVSADGQRLEGTVWLNSAQAEWPAVLTRQPR